MKTRWLWWLLAMPYVVTASSTCITWDNIIYKQEPDCLEYRATWDIKKLGMQFRDKDFADDMAEALNEAHERRTQKMYVTTDGMKFKSYLDSMNHQSIINGLAIGVKSLPSDNNCADADSHCCTDLNGNIPR